MQETLIRPIAYMRGDFPEKFGVPRQSGMVEEVTGEVVFVPPYDAPEALRGIGGFSHVWLIWGFSQARAEGFRPTVRPPRLGGNTRVGVFASRAPYRPNGLGLSCVRLLEARPGRLLVAGADLVDGTPIYDVKPYLPYTDSRPAARAGYSAETLAHRLRVQCPEALLHRVPAEKRRALLDVLALDPRPGYENDPAARYGLAFAGLDIGFAVDGDTLTVLRVTEKGEET